MRKITPYLFIGFIAIAMILAACKKDDSTPTEVNTYTGSTSDFMPMSASTGTINGETWLLSYAVDMKYVIGGITYEENFVYSSPTGIVKLVSNAFQFESADGLVVSGGLDDGGKTMVGQYNWNYTQGLIHTGDFTAYLPEPE